MSAGQSSGTGAMTELDDDQVRKDDILSNRDKAQRPAGQSMDGKRIQADEYKDNPTNRRPSKGDDHQDKLGAFIAASPVERIADIGPKPQSFNIENATQQNTDYRSVAWSGRYLQVTLMSIPVGGSIGLEAHPETDQFLRLEAGSGKAQMGDSKDTLTFDQDVAAGWCVLVPAGTWHNITNVGATPMQVYTIYAPAHHAPDKVQLTAADAAADTHDNPASWSVQPKQAPDKHG